MKRVSALILFFVLLILAVPRAGAAPPNGTVPASVYDCVLDRIGPEEALPVVALRLDGEEVTGEMPGVVIGGRTMAPLRLLAERLGAEVEWVPDRSQVLIRRGSNEIRLTLGAAYAQVNGKTVRLPDGVPAGIVVYRGQGYTMVPLRFFSETLGCRVGWLQGSYTATVDGPGSPLHGLSAPIDPEQRLVVLDAGHGGADPGACYQGVQEKTLNLAIVKKTRDILTDLGYRVLLTREGDVYPTLTERTALANRVSASVFVSVHCNAYTANTGAAGIHVYHYPGSAAGQALAQAVQTPVCTFTGAVDRGTAEGDFHVVRETRMPAVLVESGFMTNGGELARLQEDTYQLQLARGIAQGIVAYLNGDR